MSVIDIELAMKHLLAEPEDQDLVQSQLDGAEEAAQQFLQRRFFADQAAVELAKSTTLQRTQAARDTYRAALLVADAPENADDRCRLRERARQALADAFEAIDMDEFGIVINKGIVAACLLKLGHLFANREEVVTGTIATELPLTSKALLMPYRIRMGV
ncbi:phage gp6-like head-tail connector protein [Pseudomonas simiae]|uniref:head-tail connector protein n=1 Tax=Pseudomonas simiae TaxID=321846 RepID=UPI0018E29E17|nr:head-tail connector protein [Pseudomonas simiae]QQD28882.1 phage gp6-like head-tail connector protein [Pseudomonas simiae]